MIHVQKEKSDRRLSALTAGISLIVMALTAFFAYGYAHGSLVVQGDPKATWDHILSSEMLFKAEILGWLIILICDIVVAWAFYIYLRPIHKWMSLLGACFRLVYSAVLGIALLNLIFAMQLSYNPSYLSAFTLDQLQANVMLFLEVFDTVWSIGLVIFGGHLLIVGYLALKSDSIPKIIGLLMLLASIGYIVIHLGSALLPQYDKILTILDYVFIVPMTAGELGFGLWLLFRGWKSVS
ncbi:DUF4386 domain-containing protein [Paenibacillus harenae]|uniref:DUF4386 domain-containing protein n=1 Tax=Paenibacillus harenae TaxID=306543 RepID=UPI00278E2C85|nr:DUF4386 domain-containing protein [Paenibacillus harenae]MDQ0061683.1 hypothetical protein [Paenibacillus harenae]